MFSERAIQPTAPTVVNRIEDLPEEVLKLEETIQLIDDALAAEGFNEGDRKEVERSREFFANRYDTILELAGQSIKSAQLAA